MSMHIWRKLETEPYILHVAPDKKQPLKLTKQNNLRYYHEYSNGYGP